MVFWEINNGIYFKTLQITGYNQTYLGVNNLKSK